MNRAVKIFHISLALIILCAHLYLLTHMDIILPKLSEAMFTGYYHSGKAKVSLWIVMALPFVSACCFLFPKWLMIRFSPRTKLLGEPIINSAGWYLLGYLLIMLTAVTLMGFT